MPCATKKAIKNSLKKMLLEKPVNKITISDITNDCGISRMTFYYHFTDIYDLVVWVWVEEFGAALDGKKTYDTWQQGFLQIFQAISDNKFYVQNIYRALGRERVETYLYTLTYDLLLGVIEEQAIGMKVDAADKQFIADFYKFAFVGLVLDWVQSSMRKDPKKIIDQISILIEGDIRKALNTCRMDRISAR